MFNGFSYLIKFRMDAQSIILFDGYRVLLQRLLFTKYPREEDVSRRARGLFIASFKMDRGLMDPILPLKVISMSKESLTS